MSLGDGFSRGPRRFAACAARLGKPFLHHQGSGSQAARRPILIRVDTGTGRLADRTAAQPSS